ncbi:MAG: alpha/beta hydrolase, partial [Pedobacter sp.]
PAEMHIYQAGGHGFGLNNKTTKEDWFLSLKNWMTQNSWL